MPLDPPSYLVAELAVGDTPRYAWDDWQLRPFYECHDVSQVQRWATLHEAAICGLTIAMAEWVIFKLQRFEPDPEPLQILEAAWCANIDRRYTEGLEVSRQHWQGPLRAPQMVAFDIMHEALYEFQDGAEKPLGSPCLMAQLVKHVCVAEHFDGWLTECLARLHQYYVAPDPMDDLFDETSEGLLIPREAFNPANAFDPGQAPELTRQLLRSVDPEKNPYLCLPEHIVATGFADAP
jgi:hypothetical protein